ncbi:Protein of unknown function [Cotesia congregata]|uniref:Uncharacterized protein n=1 Tax=Cotesia congregata TaxID=51543 RepID=A0A8J2MPM9_COTCN|nr:Protein of unknown function [Cotesia congregata]
MSLNHSTNWTNKTGFKFSTSKSEFMIFTLKIKSNWRQQDYFSITMNYNGPSWKGLSLYVFLKFH